jgi:very-short-patch-repair endonuclease
VERPRIMTPRTGERGATGVPPLEKGRSASAASRVGIRPSRFDLTRSKTARARQLRRNSTDAEMKLWQRLRNKQLGVDFRRQHPTGTYVLDFYCPALGLAIEVDGGQHALAQQRDARRDAWFAEGGVTVLRFWNSDVMENFNGVLEAIHAKVRELRAVGMTPTRRWRADLSLSGGGNRESRHR